MTSEEMQCLNPLIKIAIPVKKTDKPNGENVVTLMYWRKVIIVELWFMLLLKATWIKLWILQKEGFRTEFNL